MSGLAWLHDAFGRLHGMVGCPEGEAPLVDGVQGRAEVSPVMGVLGAARRLPRLAGLGAPVP